MNMTLSRREVLRKSIISSSMMTIYTTSSSAQKSGDDNWPQFGRTSTNSRFSENSNVSGYSASRQWNLNVSDPVQSGISVTDNTVYFADAVGRVYQLTSDGRTQIYQQGVRDSVEPDTSLPTSTPAILGDNLYFGGLSGNIICIDVSSNQEQWSYDTSASVRSPLLIADGQVIAGDTDGDVMSVKTDTGEENWVYSTEESIRTSAVLFEASVYIGTDNGRIHIIDADSGDGEEISMLNTELSASPVADNSAVYFVTTNGNVVAIDPTENELAWELSIEASVSATPAVGNRTLYVGTEDGIVIAINKVNGNERWSIDLGEPIEQGIALTGEIVVCGTADGFLYGVDTEDEEIRWEYEIGSSITTPISVSNSIIYFGDRSGRLFAVTAEGDLVNSLWDGLQTRNPEVVKETIDETVPPEAQGVVGIGTAGLVTYLTAGWLRGKKEQSDSTEVSSTTSPASLSGDANPINKLPIEPDTNLHMSGVTYQDFEKIERLGSGGSADVYKANWKSGSSDFVALKVPRTSGTNTLDTAAFSDFIEEAKIWNDIDDHARIASVHAWGNTPLPWIAVEYLDGGDLNQQELDYEDVFVELEGFAEGLHHAHRHGVTHTDLKPENILYTEIEGQPVGKITDWGLANILLDHSMSVDGLTPSYSAPEQFRPEKYGGTDERTDIYQLGVVAYELFTGELPFGSDSQGEGVMAVLNEDPTVPSEINSNLIEEIDRVLLKVLSKQKEYRHETALHFRDDLRRAYESFTA
jgi:outer membrane protein assembly factor BamB